MWYSNIDIFLLQGCGGNSSQALLDCNCVVFHKRFDGTDRAFSGCFGAGMYSAGSLQTFQTSVGELAATNVAYNYMGHTAERNAASSKRVIYVIRQTTI